MSERPEPSPSEATCDRDVQPSGTAVETKNTWYAQPERWSKWRSGSDDRSSKDRAHEQGRPAEVARRLKKPSLGTASRSMNKKEALADRSSPDREHAARRLAARALRLKRLPPEEQGPTDPASLRLKKKPARSNDKSIAQPFGRKIILLSKFEKNILKDEKISKKEKNKQVAKGVCSTFVLAVGCNLSVFRKII